MGRKSNKGGGIIPRSSELLYQKPVNSKT